MLQKQEIQDNQFPKPVAFGEPLFKDRLKSGSTYCWKLLQEESSAEQLRAEAEEASETEGFLRSSRWKCTKVPQSSLDLMCWSWILLFRVEPRWMAESRDTESADKSVGMSCLLGCTKDHPNLAQGEICQCESCGVKKRKQMLLCLEKSFRMWLRPWEFAFLNPWMVGIKIFPES